MMPLARRYGSSGSDWPGGRRKTHNARSRFKFKFTEEDDRDSGWSVGVPQLTPCISTSSPPFSLASTGPGAPVDGSVGSDRVTENNRKMRCAFFILQCLVFTEAFVSYPFSVALSRDCVGAMPLKQPSGMQASHSAEVSKLSLKLIKLMYFRDDSQL